MLYDLYRTNIENWKYIGNINNFFRTDFMKKTAHKKSFILDFNLYFVLFS